jgi:hypothetical protein
MSRMDSAYFLPLLPFLLSFSTYIVCIYIYTTTFWGGRNGRSGRYLSLPFETWLKEEA